MTTERRIADNRRFDRRAYRSGSRDGGGTADRLNAQVITVVILNIPPGSVIPQVVFVAVCKGAILVGLLIGKPATTRVYRIAQHSGTSGNDGFVEYLGVTVNSTSPNPQYRRSAVKTKVNGNSRFQTAIWK